MTEGVSKKLAKRGIFSKMFEGIKRGQMSDGRSVWFNYVMMPRLNMTIEERLIIRYNKGNLHTSHDQGDYHT